MTAAVSDIEERFRNIGGIFLTPASVITGRLQAVRAIVFDWDGVFNSGVKSAAASSGFSEPDSMGTNLLRFAFWHGRGSLPVCAIISGEHNHTAKQFATREHFDAIYLGSMHKKDALDKLCDAHELKPGEVACVFDDANDLSIAAECSVRVLVRRDASPLLQDFVAMNSLCDYVTGSPAGAYAVRETAELFMGLLGLHDLVVAARMAAESSYAEYFAERQSIQTRITTVG